MFLFRSNFYIFYFDALESVLNVATVNFFLHPFGVVVSDVVMMAGDVGVNFINENFSYEFFPKAKT